MTFLNLHLGGPHHLMSNSPTNFYSTYFYSTHFYSAFYSAMTSLHLHLGGPHHLIVTNINYFTILDLLSLYVSFSPVTSSEGLAARACRFHLQGVTAVVHGCYFVHWTTSWVKQGRIHLLCWRHSKQLEKHQTSYLNTLLTIQQIFNHG